MVKDYDFVITSGGIGPTHDGMVYTRTLQLLLLPYTAFPDITYASLATAFSQPLKHDQETLRRMMEASKNRPDILKQTGEQKVARERMALFPSNAEVLFVEKGLWVVRPTVNCAPYLNESKRHTSLWCASRGNYVFSQAFRCYSRGC